MNVSHHSVYDCVATVGLELLDALEEGALMRLRREHMGRSSTGMGKNAHVRCVAEGFQARLLFDGQVMLQAVALALIAWYACIAQLLLTRMGQGQVQDLRCLAALDISVNLACFVSNCDLGSPV